MKNPNEKLHLKYNVLISFYNKVNELLNTSLPLLNKTKLVQITILSFIFFFGIYLAAIKYPLNTLSIPNYRDLVTHFYLIFCVIIMFYLYWCSNVFNALEGTFFSLLDILKIYLAQVFIVFMFFLYALLILNTFNSRVVEKYGGSALVYDLQKLEAWSFYNKFEDPDRSEQNSLGFQPINEKLDQRLKFISSQRISGFYRDFLFIDKLDIDTSQIDLTKLYDIESKLYRINNTYFSEDDTLAFLKLNNFNIPKKDLEGLGYYVRGHFSNVDKLLLLKRSYGRLKTEFPNDKFDSNYYRRMCAIQYEKIIQDTFNHFDSGLKRFCNHTQYIDHKIFLDSSFYEALSRIETYDFQELFNQVMAIDSSNLYSLEQSIQKNNSNLPSYITKFLAFNSFREGYNQPISLEEKDKDFLQNILCYEAAGIVPGLQNLPALEDSDRGFEEIMTNRNQSIEEILSKCTRSKFVGQHYFNKMYILFLFLFFALLATLSCFAKAKYFLAAIGLNLFSFFYFQNIYNYRFSGGGGGFMLQEAGVTGALSWGFIIPVLLVGIFLLIQLKIQFVKTWYNYLIYYFAIALMPAIALFFAHFIAEPKLKSESNSFSFDTVDTLSSGGLAIGLEYGIIGGMLLLPLIFWFLFRINSIPRIS